MSPSSEYGERGAVLLQRLVPAEIAHALAHQLAQKVARQGAQLLVPPSIGNKPCYELYGYQWPLLVTFLWGMTPRIAELVGRELLPTYCYFRTYQAGDVCRVHSDRPACEHSLSLTLAYADDRPWALAVADHPVDDARRKTDRGDPDFGDEPYSEHPMLPGDGVLYRGYDYRHGRPSGNPNRWSAHLFMHWISRDGPFAEDAFDRQPLLGPVDFRFPG